MEKKLYVAYGSNLNMEQMSVRCPDAEVVGRGTIEDYKLTFNRVATIVPQQGRQVPVGVWRVSAHDEVALDIYEGFPRLYRKEDIDVKMENGETLRGMVYIMNVDNPGMPNAGYLHVIAQGYDEVGLDKSYLLDALNDTKERMEK